MKDYTIKDKYIEIELDTGKKIKVDKAWTDKSVKALDTDLEDVLLMYLEDNGYLDNEELEELDTKAKKQVKNIVKSSTTERKKVTRERKPNVDKEYIIDTIAKVLGDFATNVNIENIGKIITFTYKNKQFKLDLIEKRVKKSE